MSEKEKMDDFLGKLQFNIEDKSNNIIKVIGVGGGGSNAVRHMYKEGVENVSFVVCNTDSQALAHTDVPLRLQLGTEGLGVGGDPEKGHQAAEYSIDDIKSLFNDGTQMVFITAGMGGGTGTGAAPVIAKVAKDMGILTVGVVTLPFRFEKRKRIEKALQGMTELKKCVDSLLVINNERLIDTYSDGMITIDEAFAKADDILATATKTIAEIITKKGTVNRDFCDVKSVMQDAGSAVVSIGKASGENRIYKAMANALTSPLLDNVDKRRAKRLLYIIYSSKSKPVVISETAEVNDFMDELDDNLEVFWGLYEDDTLEDEVKVAIIATGFDTESVSVQARQDDEDKQRMIDLMREKYYGKSRSVPKAFEQELPFEENKKEEKSTGSEVEENEDAVGVETECDETKITDADSPSSVSRWKNRIYHLFKTILDEEVNEE
ncbi:MAG: cell division protein FtsZ [Bacteroidaceae bacterium]|nr:cell division protein FtsZ [Bacteroidaceae bacterium]